MTTYKKNDDNKNDGAMTKMLSYSSFAVFYGIGIHRLKQLPYTGVPLLMQFSETFEKELCKQKTV